MFPADIPKIFDRNFIVAHLLPAAAFVGFSLKITHRQDLMTFGGLPGGAGFIAFCSLVAIFLLAANRSITRLFEGYPFKNRRCLTWVQRRRFLQLQRRLVVLDNQWPLDPKLEIERSALMVRLAERFPDEEHWILPTSFGNAIRAFEVYSRKMYEFQIIEGWTRLLTVVPKEFRELLDAAKADTDLWVNVWFLSLVGFVDGLFSRFTVHRPSEGTNHWLLGQLGIMTFGPELEMWLSCAIAMTSAFCAAWLATRAAVEWGSLVKASVDVYLPSLYRVLSFQEASDAKSVKDQWMRFSAAIKDRRPDQMPERMWGGTRSSDVEATQPQKSQAEVSVGVNPGQTK